MREKIIEQNLVKAIKDKGGFCLKFNTLSLNGMPDRLILLPKGKLAFVELKAPNKKPRAIQLKRIKQLEALGFKCFVIDDLKQIGEVIDEI